MDGNVCPLPKGVLSASSRICGRGHTLPSMEKTPSVTINLVRPSCDSCKPFSKSAISLCLYLYFLDFVSLIPSIIEAWLSSSDKITSSGPQICSKRPALASKQEG